MDLTGLLEAERGALDDTLEPYLYSTADLTRWTNEAQMEACLRARLLTEYEHPKLCRIPLVIGQRAYRFDRDRIVAVRAVNLDGATPLDRINLKTLERLDPGWRRGNAPNATPKRAVFDVAWGRIYLHPAPVAEGTLHLDVWRLPLASEELDTPSAEPIVPLPDHEQLIHWPLYRAFMQKDSEKEDTKRAEMHLAIFEAAFGKRPTLQQRILWSTQRMTGVTATFF